MSKLNHDVLCEIFQNLQDLINMTYTNDPDNLNKMINYKEFLRSQFSCLLVNKNWCEAMIPFLWSNPFKYAYKAHINSLLFKIIISHLPDNSIKLLKDENIIETNFQKLKLSFNYVRFCKYFNDIHNTCTEMLLREEIYKFFISECSSIKSLNTKMICYPILKYPGANISLSNLYELDCITNYQDFYYELAQICKSIEKIHVVNDYEESFGVVKLIEMQTQIKYVFIDGFYDECKKIIQALEKHVNSIIYLEITEYTSAIHFLILKLINLRYLKVLYNGYWLLEKYVIYLNYHNLQVLDLHHISLDIAMNIIKNTNGNLWKIRIGNTKYYDKTKEYNQIIHKYCPNIKYVTVFLNRDGTLEGLEKIFIKCQHLEAIDINEEINYKYIDKFLNLLLELAPLTLCKIRIYDISNCFNSDESLKLFLINWGHHKGKKTLHLYSDYTNIIRDIIHKYDINDFWNYYISW